LGFPLASLSLLQQIKKLEVCVFPLSNPLATLEGVAGSEHSTSANSRRWRPTLPVLRYDLLPSNVSNAPPPPLPLLPVCANSKWVRACGLKHSFLFVHPPANTSDMAKVWDLAVRPGAQAVSPRMCSA